jgi:hypothetical protein
MAFALHKLRHYLLGNKFFFNVNHIALVYLVNKPQVLWRIVRWLLSFFEYNFIVLYKLGRTHVVTNSLSRLPVTTKPIGVPNQITYANLFYIEPEWLNDAREFLRTR